MPVSIDEVTAEVEPRVPRERGTTASRPEENSPEREMRKLQEILARAEARAARICAD